MAVGISAPTRKTNPCRSALGARVKYEFLKDASLLFAVFNGDPAGPCRGEPDTCNRYGLNFRLNDPAFRIV
jgi:porin